MICEGKVEGQRGIFHRLIGWSRAGDGDSKESLKMKSVANQYL